ncbi:MAG: iron-sulfur cluster repair di-iron protein [Planctomycetota bacterium]
MHGRAGWWIGWVGAALAAVGCQGPAPTANYGNQGPRGADADRSRQVTTSTYEQRTVGELVAERPARARVFERFGIDYCCGGGLALEEAAAQQKADLKAVAASLRALDAQPRTAAERNWLEAPLAELIGNILDTHHAYLRRELPRLTGLAEKVEGVHAERHPELRRVRELHAEVREELEGHMLKEERILFPIIRAMEATGSTEAAFCGSVQHPIRVMEMEHTSAGEALDEFRKLTNEYEPPADACGSYRALLAGLAELEADLHAHIHKENNVLFPRAIALEQQCAAREQAG